MGIKDLYATKNLSLLNRRVEFVQMHDTQQNPSKGKVSNAQDDSPQNNDGVSHQEQKDEDPSALFRSKEWLEWKKVTSFGPGFYNMANTCFMNSVLQCMVYTAPLVSLLIGADHKSKCQANGNFCVLCALSDLIKKCMTPGNNRKAIMPKIFISTLKHIAKHMRVGRQEDAHEYLRFLVDAIEVADGYTKSMPGALNIFRGYLKTRIICSSCKTETGPTEPFLDLSLDISQKTNTISDCMDEFFTVEHLNGKNKYSCDKCKKPRDSTKSMAVKSFPAILTLHLKRFCYGARGMRKVDKFIQFPEHLEMKNSQGEVFQYSLQSVIVHMGFSNHSGHYYAFVKAPNDAWYCVDDDDVRQVKLSTVLKQSAYVLMYKINAKGPAKTAAREKDVAVPSARVPTAVPLLTPVPSPRTSSLSKSSVSEPTKRHADILFAKIEAAMSSKEKAKSLIDELKSKEKNNLSSEDILFTPKEASKMVLEEKLMPPSPPASEADNQSSDSSDVEKEDGDEEVVKSAPRIAPDVSKAVTVNWNDSVKNKKEKLQQVIQIEKTIIQEGLKCIPLEKESSSGFAYRHSSSKVSKRPSSYDLDYDRGKQKKLGRKKQWIRRDFNAGSLFDKVYQEQRKRNMH